MVRFVCILVLAFALPLRAETPVETPAEALRRIGATWASGDTERFAKTLAPSFPNAPRELLRMKSRFRARCVVVKSTVPSMTTADDARASGVLTFELRESLRNARVHERIEDVEVDLAIVDGAWKVVRWTRVVDAIATRLAEADANADLLGLTFDAIPDRELVRTIARQAVELNNLSRREQAQRVAAVASILAATLGDDAALAAAAHADLVVTQTPTSDRKAWRERAANAHALALRSGDPDVIAATQGYVGRLYLDEDESSREAERILLEIVEHEDELSEPSTSVRAATNAGVTRLTRGDYRGALDLFRRALERSTLLDDRVTSSYLRLHIGRIYDRQNDLELAMREYRQALALVAPDSTPEALIRQAMARTLLRLGKKEESDREQHAALELSRKLARPGLIAMTLVAMSESALLAGDAETAAKHASEAVSQARQVGYRPAEIDALLTLAEIERTRGRHEQALAWIAEVLKLDATLEDIGFAMPAALMLAARSHHALGAVDEERRALQQAIAHIEQSRTQVAGGERQLRLFFQPHSAAYTMMAAAAARAGDAGEALAYAERGRARVLFDLLARRPHGDGELAPIAGALPAPLPTSTGEELARIVEPGMLLVEYVVGDEETQLIAIRRDDGGAVRITLHTIAVGRTELARRTDDLVRRIAGRDLRYREAAKAMYALLLAPVDAELAGAKAFGICADGPLWSLPFEALVGSDGAFLTERIATFYMPSISAYRALRERAVPAHRSVFLVADAPAPKDAAPLPDAREEAKQLAQLYGVDETLVRVGASATEHAVKRDAPAFSVLHFAVHGVLDDRDPMYSRVLLGPGNGEDGALEAWELAGLPLRADMVVLSACDTGRGRVYAGEGVVGMAWALFAAGSRSVVASHWPVSSRATKALMIEFHRRYRASAGKAEALRQARLTVLRDGMTRHPFYWAAFVVLGP